MFAAITATSPAFIHQRAAASHASAMYRAVTCLKERLLTGAAPLMPAASSCSSAADQTTSVSASRCCPEAASAASCPTTRDDIVTTDCRASDCLDRLVSSKLRLLEEHPHCSWTVELRQQLLLRQRAVQRRVVRTWQPS